MIKDLISEIALKCGDPEFKEFGKSEYMRALHRSNRQIAKLYGIDEKIFEFTLSEYGSEDENDIILDLPDFKAAVDVFVNGVRMYKTDGTLDRHYQWAYYIRWINGELHFNYVKGQVGAIGMDISGLDITEVMSTGITERETAEPSARTKSSNDQVVIRYYVIPDYETTKNGEFIIPSEYEEQQILKGIIEMTDLGIAKYPSGEMAEKWVRLYKRYKERLGQYDMHNVRDQEWVKIQPFKYP